MREPPLPLELQLMQQPTSPASALAEPGVLATRAPAPGLALAAGRVPGAPTMPDWDPSSFTRVVFQVANELFGAPAAPQHLQAAPTAPTAPTAPGA